MRKIGYLSLIVSLFVLVLVGLVSGDYCCEKSKENKYCSLESSEDLCDNNFLSAEVRIDCSETSFCNVQCCILDGVCNSNVKPSECVDEGGEVREGSDCSEVVECQEGCCNLESLDCSTVSKSECAFEGSDLREVGGFVDQGEFSFEPGVSDLACKEQCGGGCCELGGGRCENGELNECSGVFNAGVSCSNVVGCEEEDNFNRVCENGDIHWVNSFGEIGEVVKRGDTDNNPFIDFNDINGECGTNSCGCENSLDSCGECSGVELKCMPNNCEGFSEGDTWCGSNNDLFDLGSDHIVYSCLNGEKVLWDTCGNYREGVCGGEEGNNHCVDNNWRSCSSYTEGGEDECKVLGDCEYLDRVYEKEIIVKGKIKIDFQKKFGGELVIDDIPFSCSGDVFDETYPSEGKLICLESSIGNLENFEFKEEPTFKLWRPGQKDDDNRGKIDKMEFEDSREDSWDLRIYESGKDDEWGIAYWEAKGEVYLDLSKCVPEYAPGNSELCEECVVEGYEGWERIFSDFEVCGLNECSAYGDCKYEVSSEVVPVVANQIDCSIYTNERACDRADCDWKKDNNKFFSTGVCENINNDAIPNIITVKKVSCEEEKIPLNGDCNECNEVFCTEYMCKSLGENCEYNKDNLFCYDQSPTNFNIDVWKKKFEDQGIFSFDSYEKNKINGKSIVGEVSAFDFEVGIETDEPVKECRYSFELERYEGMDLMVSADYSYLDCRVMNLDLGRRNIKWFVGMNLGFNEKKDVFVKCKNFGGREKSFVVGLKSSGTVDKEIPRIGFLLNDPINVASEIYELKFYVNEDSECREGSGNFENMGIVSCSGKGRGIFSDWNECSVEFTGLVLGEERDVRVGCKDLNGNIGYGERKLIRSEFGIPVVLVVYRDDLDVPTDLNLETSISAVCKWDLEYKDNYEDMIYDFDETGSKEHRTEINVNNLFVGCKDMVSGSVGFEEYEFV